VSSHRVRRVLRIVCSLGCVTAVVAVCYHLPHVNETTVALTVVLAILMIASRWGFPEAIAASIVGGIQFDYFFLPPFGIGIQELHHWVAQIAFLTTAILGGRLSAKAKTKAEEARARQEEIQKLFNLQQAIHSEKNLMANPRRIPECIQQAFVFDEVACCFEGLPEVHRFGAGGSLIPNETVLNVAANRKTFVDKSRSLIVVPTTFGGKSSGSLGVHGNVSNQTILHTIVNLLELEVERARSLEEAQQVEAARKGEELKSVMLDGLAHDLKTPLTTIKAAITCLMTQGSYPSDELLCAINEETDHLNQLVTETISIARADSDRIQLESDQYGIKELIETTLREMEPVLAGRLVQAQTPVDPPQVECDFNLIKLVLKQLLDNAVKYSPSGSPVTVSCKSLIDAVEVQVIDAGAGIAEEEQKYIFDKFYRSQSGTEVPGTGMGLAIAKRIIEAHGGRIWVGSRPGIGSVFHFSLPLQKELIPSVTKEF